MQTSSDTFLQKILCKLKGPWTSFQDVFFIEFLDEIFSFVMLQKLVKFHDHTVYFPRYSVNCVSCFMLGHLMTSWRHRRAKCNRKGNDGSKFCILLMYIQFHCIYSQSNHDGCIKPGFITDNYIESHAHRKSVTYKIEQNDFDIHCVKSVRIWSYWDPYILAFGLNRERHSLSPRIQSEIGKIRTGITQNTDTVYAVNILLLDSPNTSNFACTLLWNKYIFQVRRLNYEILIIYTCLYTFFWKRSALNSWKRKRVSA